MLRDRPLPVILLLLFSALAVGATAGAGTDGSTWLDEAGNWSSIVAGSIAALVFVVGIVLWLRRRWHWRRPLTITYFIPEAQQPATYFPGAPEQPQCPTTLTVGIGRYCLIHRISVKTPNLVILGIQVEFQGEPKVARPQNYGLTAAALVRRFESELGEELYEDWWGMSRSLRNVANFPKHFTGDNDHWLAGHVIETSARWEGTAQVVIRWRSESGHESSSVRVPLAFSVTDDATQDEIPFLRRDEAVDGT